MGGKGSMHGSLGRVHVQPGKDFGAGDLDVLGHEARDLSGWVGGWEEERRFESGAGRYGWMSGWASEGEGGWVGG